MVEGQNYAQVPLDMRYIWPPTEVNAQLVHIEEDKAHVKQLELQVWQILGVPEENWPVGQPKTQFDELPNERT